MFYVCCSNSFDRGGTQKNCVKPLQKSTHENVNVRPDVDTLPTRAFHDFDNLNLKYLLHDAHAHDPSLQDLQTEESGEESLSSYPIEDDLVLMLRNALSQNSDHSSLNFDNGMYQYSMLQNEEELNVLPSSTPCSYHNDECKGSEPSCSSTTECTIPSDDITLDDHTLEDPEVATTECTIPSDDITLDAHTPEDPEVAVLESESEESFRDEEPGTRVSLDVPDEKWIPQLSISSSLSDLTQEEDGNKKGMTLSNPVPESLAKVPTALDACGMRLYNLSKTRQEEGKRRRKSIDNRPPSLSTKPLASPVAMYIRVCNDSKESVQVDAKKCLKPTHSTAHLRLYSQSSQSKKFREEGKQRRLRAMGHEGEQRNLISKALPAKPNAVHLRLYRKSAKFQQEGKQIRMEVLDKDAGDKKTNAKALLVGPSAAQLRLYNDSKTFRDQGKQRRITALEKRSTRTDPMISRYLVCGRPSTAQLRLYNESKKLQEEGKERRKRVGEKGDTKETNIANLLVKPSPTQIRLYSQSKPLQEEGKKRRKEVLEKLLWRPDERVKNARPTVAQMRLYTQSQHLQDEGKQRRREVTENIARNRPETPLILYLGKESSQVIGHSPRISKKKRRRTRKAKVVNE